MFDMLTGQYKNLASKGRYGDTMLAHINPQEAGMLRAMGGAGTINPQTGLREFYGMNQMAALGLTPEPYQAPFGTYDMRGTSPNRPAPFDAKYADSFGPLRVGGAGISGYTVPTDDKTFLDKPLDAKYDSQGNFRFYSLQAGDYFTPDPSQPNIQSAPRISATGEVEDWGIVDVNQQDDGGFGSFIGDLISDFGPMILAGIGANLLGPAIAGAGAAGGAAGGTLAGMGTGAAGAAATAAATGIPLAALTAGGITEAGLLAGGGSSGGLAGFGTGAAGVNATAAATGLTPAALGVTGLTAAIPTPSVPTPSVPTPSAPTPASTPPVTPPVSRGSPLSGVTPSAVPAAVTNAATTAASTLPDLSSLGGVGGAIIDFAKANPSIAGSLLGAVTSAIGGANAPTAQTTTSSIDPDIKTKYLAYLEDAKLASTGLLERKFAPIDPMYTTAETNLYNLGMTPFGAAVTPSAVTPTATTGATTLPVLANDIARFFNPYENQVVTNTLADIESARKIQEQANRDRALQARAFGGSRQAVVSGMTNEAALRQSANTAAQLRSAGFTQAANLGLAARPLDIAGLQTSLGLGAASTSLAQQKLDAARNLALEKLSITGGALGLQPARTGETTSTPLYNNTAGNLLSGGLTGAYIGSLLGKT